MSATLSKRQQARNEKLLQDLVRSVPGNNECADCHTRNPAWASWSLGVFLCMRCAAIHRKLGTHISKVKSLSMDSWSNEQVDNMRKVGNVASNRIYNPESRRPPVPVDADEADSAMERFIRQKYITNVAIEQSKTGRPASDEGTPPPLPPKNSAKFSFRSASSIFPLPSRTRKEARMSTIARPSPDPMLNASVRSSNIFGTSADRRGLDDSDLKLAKLRDMGFQDGQRNAIVLKGVQGNLDRAVEALVRLGEGDGRTAVSLGAPREHTLRATRSLTPLAPTGGLRVNLTGLAQNSTTERPTTASTTPANPFDLSPPAQPQTAQSTGSLQVAGSYGLVSSPNNPFGNLQLQQTQAAGPTQQTISPQLTSSFGSQPSARQPGPAGLEYGPGSEATSGHYFQPPLFNGSMTYPQAVHSAPLGSPMGGNPFFSQPSSPDQALAFRQRLSVGASLTQNGPATSNPFTRASAGTASPLGQIVENGQTTFISYSPQPMPTNNNPFFTGSMPNLMTQQAEFSSYGQPSSQQRTWQDKASIMALYNQPQTLSSPDPPPPEPRQPMQVAAPATQLQPQQRLYQGATSQARSASYPLLGNTNPYLRQETTTMAAPTAVSGLSPFASSKHVSRESMNLGIDLAWTNGRHSPDAFASLSARHV